MVKYGAFISYSHAKDYSVAAALQAAVQTLGRPWYKLRARRVFRDDSSLPASEHLWTSIKAALDESKFFILLASPESAISKSVANEVSYWLEKRGTDGFLIGLTGGALSWNNEESDFDWTEQNPLPTFLKNRFATEPKWVDLRAFRDAVTQQQITFLDNAASFAAAIEGIPKENLLVQDRKRRRQVLALAWSVSCLLLILSGTAVWQWRTAIDEKHVAQSERDRAEQQKKRAEENYAAAKDTVRGLLQNIAQGLRFVPGMRAETVTTILKGVNVTVDSLINQNPKDDDLKLSRAVMFDEFEKLYLQTGDSAKAIGLNAEDVSLFRDMVRSNPSNALYNADLVLSLARMGEIKINLGDMAGARQAYEEAVAQRDIMASNTKPDDDNDVVVTNANGWAAFAFVRLGWLISQAGDSTRARQYYERGAKLVRNMGQHANDFARTALVISLTGIAEIQIAQGDHEGSQRNVDELRETLRTISFSNPDNLEYTGLMALALAEVAYASDSSGDFQGARTALDEAVSLMRKVSSSDPDNRSWAGYLADLLTKSAHIDGELGRIDLLQQEANAGRDILLKLTTQEPHNTEWQRYLFSNYEVVGDSERAANNWNGARDVYEKMTNVGRVLVGLDTSFPEWQRLLTVGLEKTGDAKRKLNDETGAQSAFQEEMGIARGLIAKQPDNPVWNRILAISNERLGDCKFEIGDFVGAQTSFNQEAEIAAKFLGADSTNTDWGNIRSYALRRIADTAAKK
jgi:tetratricopeptide (TPR) repeat protein